ncbi:hypothetical protein NQZ68_029104 [Dissostichus eleginoides]|nr:hypothetical protein NQZ68_029104 [Dissostichus eleginoides]
MEEQGRGQAAGRCPDIKLPHCWTSAWMSGPLPAVLPHPPTGSYCIIPHPTMTPTPISANRSTTGETGEPMVEELAIWKTHLTQSAEFNWLLLDSGFRDLSLKAKAKCLQSELVKFSTDLLPSPYSA